MTGATLWAIFQCIGSAVGIIITLITFWSLVSKKPIEKFKKMIRDESANANQDLKTGLSEIKSELITTNNRLNAAEQNDVAILRNTITHIYFKFKDQKKIPHYEKENVISLYERYRNLGGNSYIKNIVKEIENWEEII